MTVIEGPEIQSANIDLTPKAAERVAALIQEKELTGHALRVFVSGGGCSGMQYGMGLEGEPQESDHHFDFGKVQVVIDPMSMTYLAGAVIDYEEDLMGGGFRIENPNAVSSCGCGHSFKTEGAHGAAAHGSGGCC